MTSNITNIVTQPVLFVTLIVVWFVIFAWLINKLFDVIVRYFVNKTRTKADDKLIPVIKNTLLVGLFVSTLYVITLFLDMSPSVHSHLETFFIAFLVAIGSFFLVNIVSIILIEVNERQYKGRSARLHTAVPFLNNISKIVIFSIGMLIIMRLYNIDITPALASAGVVGVAVAFAAKDFVANLFGGLSVFFDKPYSVGDYVIINELYRGEVQEIGMRSTKIRTRDNVLITVPNSVMVTNIVVNETGYDPMLRVRVPVQVGYEADLTNVEKVLVAVAQKNEDVVEDPEPRVRYREFHDSGINLELLIVIRNPADKGRIVHELIVAVHKEFGAKKINIPYPHREVYLHNVK